MVGVAGTAWLALLLPTVGPVQLDKFQRSHGPWIALAAIFATLASILLAATKVAQRIAEKQRGDREARRLDAKLKLEKLYEPLYRLLNDLPMSISTATGAPRFSDRMENALSIAEDHHPSIRALRSTVKALSDRQVIGPSGEMEYGARFPLERIEKLVRAHQAISDDRLLDLTNRAVRVRFEQDLDDYTLSKEDCELIDHIGTRWVTLRKQTSVNS